ncbi:hypothetical protein NOR_04685 [Metarhizium rileyi]|uniref:Uncharacterized protein n=1 Tax=Metarhizium rileyi (strain RCEF 4871) TaxID=1649241 RepID=A0A167DLH0_METRR|nr:hypothetical protein NOR_04685 [Metarhizium rileyi RCEF 4871]
MRTALLATILPLAGASPLAPIGDSSALNAQWKKLEARDLNGPSPQDSWNGPAPQDSWNGPAPQDSWNGPAPQDSWNGPAPKESWNGPGQPKRPSKGPAEEDLSAEPSDSDETDDGTSRPISFDPIPPPGNLKRPTPPVAHGTVDHSSITMGAKSEDGPAPKESLNSPEQPKRPSKGPAEEDLSAKPSNSDEWDDLPGHRPISFDPISYKPQGAKSEDGPAPKESLNSPEQPKSPSKGPAEEDLSAKPSNSDEWDDLPGHRPISFDPISYKPQGAKSEDGPAPKESLNSPEQPKSPSKGPAEEDLSAKPSNSDEWDDLPGHRPISFDPISYKPQGAKSEDGPAPKESLNSPEQPKSPSKGPAEEDLSTKPSASDEWDDLPGHRPISFDPISYKPQGAKSED